MNRERKLLAKDKVDPIWSALREQAEEMTQSEPELASFAHATILKHERLEQALSYHLAKKIGDRSESTRLNSSHSQISYAVFCLKKKNKQQTRLGRRAGACSMGR